MPETFNLPVNLAQYQRMKDNQKRLSRVLELIDKMDRCGMDCDIIRQAAKNGIDQIQAIELEFFTPAPTS